MYHTPVVNCPPMASLISNPGVLIAEFRAEEASEIMKSLNEKLAFKRKPKKKGTLMSRLTYAATKTKRRAPRPSPRKSKVRGPRNVVDRLVFLKLITDDELFNKLAVLNLFDGKPSQRSNQLSLTTEEFIDFLKLGYDGAEYYVGGGLSDFEQDDAFADVFEPPAYVRPAGSPCSVNGGSPSSSSTKAFDVKKATAKAARKYGAIVKRLKSEKKKTLQAMDYRVFPTIVQTGEGMGSWSSHTLDGRKSNRKAKAPKIVIEASGRHNAALIKCLAEINERRKTLGLEEFNVGVTDVIFTEFRDGTPRELIKLLNGQGYVPAGPGVFIRAKNKKGNVLPFAKWVLGEVVKTGQDLRSYGRSWTTSPALEMIPLQVPVHYVDLAHFGLKTDGTSLVTQGLFSSPAFQWRSATAPEDMRDQIVNLDGNPAQLESAIVKGLAVGAKVLKNVTEGKAVLVSRELWDELKKDCPELWEAHCPVVEHNGVQWQSGLFVDRKNMTKGPGKKQAADFASDDRVTTINGSNYLSFIIAEMKAVTTSIGWQTTQLIHKLIVENHEGAFRAHIDERVQRLIDRGLDAETADALKSDSGRVSASEADLTALALMRQLSGKATGHLAFGGGLSGVTNYVVEFDDLPAGWGVANMPKKAYDKAISSGKPAECFMSRYPQQGFESLLVLKTVTATDVGMLHDALQSFTSYIEGDCLALPVHLKQFFVATLEHLKAKGLDDVAAFERAKVLVHVMRNMLPFIKGNQGEAGGFFVSHADQFLKLRGDADGDKNFWSFEPWLVAVMKEVADVVRELEVPRLEIEGDGVSLGANFSEKSFFELMTSDQVTESEKLRLAELICARNNGQGPVGLIANLSTLPLSRLKWEIVDDKLVWQTEGAREFFAYLLLMQQTAIDMQKRIYPAPSLLRWRMARLFMTPEDQAEALTPPSMDLDEDQSAQYQRLLQSEIIWTMSAKYSMEMSAYEDGLMYNERVLSHWAAWVINGLNFEVDFLALDNDQLKVLSETLADNGPEAFFQKVAEIASLDLDKVTEGWVFPEDLISWKKGANLTEIEGVPAGGLGFIWQMAIDAYAKVKSERNLNGEPLEHLASVAGRWESIAANGIDQAYSYHNKDGEKMVERVCAKLDTDELRALYRAFAAITDSESTEVAESERMQGDTIKSPSDAKAAILASFDHNQWSAYRRGKSFMASLSNTGEMIAASKVDLARGSALILSNAVAYSPEKRIALTQLILKLLFAKLAELAKSSGYGSASEGAKSLNYLLKTGVVDKANGQLRLDLPSDGTDQSTWDTVLERLESRYQAYNELLSSEKYRKLVTALKRYGFPTIVDKGDLGVDISGSGWGGNVYNSLFKSFLVDLSKSNANEKDKALAEWIADTMIPAYSLGLQLANEQAERTSLINDSILTEEQLMTADPNVRQGTMSNMQLLNKEKLSEHVMDRLTLRNSLLYAAGTCSESSKIVTWVKDKIVEAFKANPDDEHKAYVSLSLLASKPAPEDKPVLAQAKAAFKRALNAPLSASHYRQAKTHMRPLMGAIRLKDWWARWSEFFGITDPSWVAGKTSNGLFNQKIKVNETSGDPEVTARWLKSRVDFQVPAFWTGVLMGQALAKAKNDFSGIYLLCQENRYSRWVYFDALTLQLAAKEVAPKKRTLLVQKYLMLHLDGNNPIDLGCAYHRAHRTALLKDLDPAGVTQVEGFANGISNAEMLSLFQAIEGFLQPHRFDYQLKGENNTLGAVTSTTVYLPYFFGANNKLSSLLEMAKWFYSSKLWSVLFSMNVPGIHDKDSMGAVFKAFWGFAYPMKRKESASSMGGDCDGTMKPKQPLEWLVKDTQAQAVNDLLTAMAAYSTADDADWRKIGGRINGFMPWQEAMAKIFDYYWGLTPEQRKSFDGSMSKAVCGLLGLSSAEYQLDNLRKDAPATPWKKHIARAWAGTSVSGLRDLFGALGSGSGWKVANTWYAGPLKFGKRDRLEQLITAFTRPEGHVKRLVKEAAANGALPSGNTSGAMSSNRDHGVDDRDED